MTGKHDLIWQSPNFGPKDRQYKDEKTFQIHALQGEQHISACGKYTLQVTARQEDLKFDNFLGKTATFTLKVGYGHTLDKNFTGIITGFTKADTCFGNLDKVAGVDRHYNYRIEIQPKLWLLTQKYDSRVFNYTHEDDLFKVLDTIFKEHGIKYSRKKAEKKEEKKPGEPDKTPPKEPAKAPPRDYHEAYYYVQYRETDFNFVSRLLEEAGIWYYFDHEDDTLILCDAMSDVPWVGPHREVSYSEDKTSYGKVGHEETLFDFYFQRHVGPNRFMINDYNYETSQTDYLSEQNAQKPKQIPELAHYEHTRDFANRDGKKCTNMTKTRDMLNQTMLEEAVTAAQVARAMSTSRSLQAGYKFTLKKHFVKDYNQTWLITSMTMSVRQGDYTVLLAGVPMENAFRPPRKTPTPVIVSQQTATVVGQPGSEVYTDDLGRCKLRFHWDKDSEHDDKASMWVRVAQGYAGQNYGIQWTPRVGHEVLVSFVDGNPAHPVINGRVYNNINKPPLPKIKKYQNIIKTIKDNHIMFDDRDGAELLDLRAQRDMNTLVLSNHNLTIGGNATEQVGGDKCVTVQKDMQVIVEGFSKTRIKQDQVTEVEEGDRWVTVKQGDEFNMIENGDMITTVGGDTLTTINGTAVERYNNGLEISVSKSPRYLDVHKDDIKWVGGNVYLRCEGDRFTRVDKKYMMEAVNYECIADEKVEIAANKILIDAGSELVLQCGLNVIRLTEEEIKIEGVKITSTSVGMHKVAGGLVLIN